MATNPYAKNFLVSGDPRYSALNNSVQTEQYGGVNPLDWWLSQADASTLPPEFWAGLGFTGDTRTQATDNADSQLSPELAQFMASRGYQNSTDGGVAFNALADAQGNYVPGSEYSNRTNDDATFIAGMLGLGAAGYSANAAGLGVDAAGNATGGAFGASSAAPATAEGASPYVMSSADKAALYGGEGYGAGMTGGETAAYSTGASSAANTGSNMAANKGTTLADFFSGNGSTSDYLRAGQALYGMYSQNKATDAAMQGNANQLALQREMWQANQAENKPLVDMRNSVLPQIQNLLANPSSITSQPDYQFGLQQGANRMNNRAAASGNYYSGAQMKAANQYGQDYAGTKLDQSLNRLMGVATGTQVGSQNNQNANNQFAVSGGNALQQGGNIRAGGYIGQYNTVNNNLNDWMQDQTNRKYWGGGG